MCLLRSWSGADWAIPSGCRGDLRMDWAGSRVLRLAFVVAPDQLPFEADLAAAERSVVAWLGDAGGSVAQVDGGLALTFPEALDG